MIETEYPYAHRVINVMYGVYGWMSCALILTAGVAYYVAATPAVSMFIYHNTFILIFLFLAQIGLVIALTALLTRITFVIALILFLLYAGLLGLTLSSIFYIYTAASIVSTFITAAGMFGIISVYGYVTKSDLTSIGNMSIMMLLGLIIGAVVNIFLRNPMVDLVLSGIGVVVFVLLTAYDTQKIKRLSQQLLADQETMAKVSILGALTLYLDFINLFLFLLRFMGRRRED